jgi:hypothetical protein
MKLLMMYFSPVSSSFLSLIPNIFIITLFLSAVNLLSSFRILRAGRSDDRGSIPGGGWEFFSLRHRLQTGSETLTVSYTMCIGGSLPGGKSAGVWSWPLTSI